MIHYLKGELIKADTAHAVVETSGIGYKVFIPASTYSQLPAKGQTLVFHTSFIVRELSQTLYGFLLVEERDLFENLIVVTGIGPKIALSIIGHLSVQEILDAVKSGDTTMISKVPGIGKKTAQRLIIELNDRLQKSLGGPVPSDFMVQIEKDPRSQKISDAMSALINLGYNQNAAQKALKKSLKTLPEVVDLPQLITDALKNV